MIVGRVVVLVLCFIGVLWVPVLLAVQGGQLFLYIQAVSAYLSPPIAAVYLLAILWPRSNERGAFWAMVVGFVVGIIRMIMDFSYPEPKCGETDVRPAVLKNFHYFYMAFLLFAISCVVNVVVSLLTDPPRDHLTVRTTVWTKDDTTPRPDEMETAGEVGEDAEKIPLQGGEGSGRDGEDEAEEKISEYKRKNRVVSFCRTLLSFVCGLDEKGEDGENNMGTSTGSPPKSITSIQQTSTVKWTLRCNSFLLVGVAIVLLVVFSIPDGGPTHPTIPIPYMPFVVNGTRP